MQQENWLYSEIVKDHFFNPRNVLKEDENTYEADGVGLVGNPACGDMMKLWIKVDSKSERITECKWKTFGCASAIGSTSMLSEMVTESGGMKLNNALSINANDIIKRLGGLPSKKLHCSVLGDKALKSAINDYFSKTKQFDRVIKENVTVVCSCMNVTDKEIEHAVVEGKTTLEQIQEATKAGTGCGQCIPEIKEIIEKTIAKYSSDKCQITS